MKNQINKPMRYIIYARKSTEDSGRQIQSIDDQINFLKKLAKEKDLDIVEIFSESKSAKKPGRPVFEKMLSFIQSKKATGILCWKLDRLSRNPKDGGDIQWYLQERIIEEIRTSDRIYLPEDNALISSVELGMANQAIRDLSRNVKRGIKSKIERGVWANRAPIGYLNKDKGIVIDKSKAKYIKRAFELYRKSNISIKEIANILFKEGFRSKAGNKYHKSKIQRMLRNTFYYGVMFIQGEYYSGTHKPIISKRLFDEVQEVLDGTNRSKRKKHSFAFRGFLYCEKCGCLLTATTKKGYNYYYCTNGKGNCEEHKRYLREEKVEKILAESLGKLKMSSEMIDIIYQSAKEKKDLKKDYRQEVLNNLQNELNSVITKQERLLEGYCSEIISKEAYGRKTKDFRKKEIDLKTQIKEISEKSSKEDSTLEQTKKLFLKACYAKKEFLQASKRRQTKTLQDVLWNATVQNQKLAKVSFKQEFQLIADTPNLNDFDTMFGDRDSNPNCLDQNQVSYH